MSLYESESIPFQREYSYRYIREVRLLRSMTLEMFSKYMKVDTATLSKLETGQLSFTIHYESKFKEALTELNISRLELMTVKRIIDLKESRERNE